MVKKDERDNLILTGFSFTGKSVVAKGVTRKMGWSLIDTDHQIAAIAGKSIPDIFAEDGEGRFRELERQVLKKACNRKKSVIAIGGGAIVDPGNRELFARSGVVVCLEAKPKTIYERLIASKQNEDTVARPLLAGADTLARITQLKASRQAYYATADWAVYTDDLTPNKVVDEVIRGFEIISARRSDANYVESTPVVVTTATESYPVFVGWGIMDDLGRRMRQMGLGGCAEIISDEAVFSYHGARVSQSLKDAGFEVDSCLVPPGETTKNIETAIKIYDWLVERRTERGHAIVALGGGMVGDLAGFVAATFLRGLPLVQVPTSLMAMADSSIGGKVAVNHPQAKNLIGAFYQPRLVLTDVSTLTTLPKRELVSGWAEVVKHGLILDAGYVKFLETNAAALASLEAQPTAEAIRRSVAIKASVVSEDEKERERRMILNYGHTIAHGIEAATDYERFLHGEAVAIGMAGAAMLSQRLGLIPRDVVTRQNSLLKGFGLPTSCSGVDPKRMLKAMALDKKVRERAVQWVLLEDIGKTTFRNDVAAEDVEGVLKKLLSD
jgi:shikimate kinase / 3-dehydroquinate synthase